MSKFGRQPGRDVIIRQGRTINGTARAIGVDHVHLKRALSGYVLPNPEVRRRLPAFLDVSKFECFNSDVLDRAYSETHALAGSTRKAGGRS